MQPAALRRFIVATIVALVGLGTAGGAAAASGRADARAVHRARHLASHQVFSPAVAQTDSGPVTGLVSNGVHEFLGIPYAAPPVGDLRWRPPQPPAHWSTPLSATDYGPTCPQSTTLGVFAEPSVSENCLYLNVFTPHLGRHRSKGLPVFVWIHGGGNFDGESNDYNGTKLATGGRYGGSNEVVVTFNYRLGLLGFLADPALDSEGHQFGNYGIMDQQAVLRWVQRNIASFGGDPHKVTLGGQSAGATDTGANVISPQSHGLFDRAIFESRFLFSVAPLSTALKDGEGFAQAAGCTGSNTAVAACLRGLSVPQILQLQGTANANGPFAAGPMVDGTVIPRSPLQAWTSGRYNHMPMMGGTVEDEGNFSIGITEYFSGPPQAPLSAANYPNSVMSYFSSPTYPAGTGAKALAEYPLSNYATPQFAFDAVTTAPGVCEDLDVAGLLAKQVPVYDYKFNYQHAPYYFPSMPGFVPLAAHTIDIQFLFPGYHGGILGVPHPLNASETTLSNELVSAWTNFALTGNPDRAGNSPWPRFTSSTRAPSVLSENVPALSTMTQSQVSSQYHCAFWQSTLGF